ncbi:unnamed protein product, partial [Durusdinium trenchii]
KCRAFIMVLTASVPSWSASLPRVVHFTRPDQPKKAGVGPFPVLIWEVALRSWQRFFLRSRGFRLRVWHDHNLTECMQQEFPEYLPAFRALPGGIERSDIGRYCVMHQQGGIYADLDYEVRAFFYTELPAHLVSLVECRSKDKGLLVENSLMASPPGHPFWRLAIRSCFDVPGRHRWDDAEGGTGPRLLSKLLGSPNVSAMVHVLSCKDFQRGIQADAAHEHCGHISDGRGQRGIHWSTTSHTAFVGAALRADAFYFMHPELKGRPLFRKAVHEVAAESARVPCARRSASQVSELLAACVRGAGLDMAELGGPGAQTTSEPFDLAEKLLQEAVEVRPEASDLRYLLGSALHSSGRRSEAIVQ